MDRAQKEKVVEELGQIFESSGVVVVAHYAGLTVAEMQDLRARMQRSRRSVRVAKNRLAKIALEGSHAQALRTADGHDRSRLFRRPCGSGQGRGRLRQGQQEVRNPWRCYGRERSGRAGVKAVAEMPSREELIASIVGCIGAPAANIAGAIGAPASNIASILSTIEDARSGVSNLMTAWG